ncbi:MAG TPA: histidine phosphatase family protein [Citricoccus sp.]
MPLATVHLVRHGEVHNPDRILYGRIPGYGLSDLGRRMAEDLGGWFAQRAEDTGRVPALLISSPLQRARETAAPIGAALGLQIGTDERVLEATNRFEGLAGVKGQLRNPRYWPLLVNPFRPSWGEPYRAQVARMAEAVQDLRDRALAQDGEGAEAIIVSHQLPIWVTRLSLEGRPLWHDPRQRECTLTSVTSLHFEAGRALPRVEYQEPNAALLPQASSLPGA